MIGIIQLLLITYAVGQAGRFNVDYITFNQFWSRIIITFIVYGILQIIKLAVSTRNTHSRDINENNLLK